MDIRSLVDLEQGVISRELFVNEELFKREMEQIFSRAWLIVGHEDMIQKPDDYVVSRMGGDSVILTRDRQGTIHVLLNTCMHRGMKLCRYDQGNTRAFTCPYHGWSYSTDGRLVEVPGELVGVPGFKDYYREKLDKKAWGLVRCPQVINHKGTIWANWDPDAPSFYEYIGDFRYYLDAALDHRDGREGGSEMIGGIQKWRVPCNWKFVSENFIGDMYHDISHRSVDLVGIGPGGKGRRDALRPRTTISFDELGHGAIAEPPHYKEPDYVPAYKLHPEAETYYRQVHEARVKNLGGRMRVTQAVGTIFPSMSFHGRQPRTIAMVHPIGPTETEIWRIFLVDRDSPQEVKDVQRHYFMRYSGPGGLTESDDLENWMYATEASRGPLARRHAYNYQMGMGYSRPIPELRGASENGEYSEGNARAFYKRWRQFMEGQSWNDLMKASRTAKEAAHG